MHWCALFESVQISPVWQSVLPVQATQPFCTQAIPANAPVQSLSRLQWPAAQALAPPQSVQRFATQTLPALLQSAPVSQSPGMQRCCVCESEQTRPLPAPQSAVAPQGTQLLPRQIIPAEAPVQSLAVLHFPAAQACPLEPPQGAQEWPAQY